MYGLERCMGLALRAGNHCNLRMDSDLTVMRPRTKPSMETLQQRSAVGQQPRGRRLPQSVPEYADIVDVQVTEPAYVSKAERAKLVEQDQSEPSVNEKSTKPVSE